MTPQEILAILSTPADRVPEEALRQAVAQRAALTAPLLDALGTLLALAQDPQAEYGEDPDPLPDMALYLLAQFREERAFPLYEALCRLPEEASERWLGFILTQDFASFLASTCGGRPGSLQRMAEDESLTLYSRWVALDALLTLVVQGAWPREEMIAWLVEVWPRWRVHSDDGGGYTPLVFVIHQLRAASLLPLVRQAYAAGRVDSSHITLGEVERTCAASGEMFPDRLRQSHGYVEDAARLMSWQFRYSHAGSEKDAVPFVPSRARQGTQVRQQAKTGRNDPCPCGSGKKYKKCCLRADGPGDPA